MFHFQLRDTRRPVFTPTFLRMTECPSFSTLNKLLLRDTIPFVLGLDIWDFVENPADCLRIRQRTSLLENVLGFPYRDFFRSRRGEKLEGLAQWNRKS
jgi:hypothetical protein